MSVKLRYRIFPIVAILLMFSCTDKVPMINLGIDSEYYVNRMTKLPLESAFTGSEYRWTLHKADGNDSILSRERSMIFLEAEEGEYSLSFDIIDDNTPYHHDFKVNVMHEEIEYSPYISKVLEYKPAPGQFVNEMPKYEDGDTYEKILQKAEESISGTNSTLISLGAYGGYVTFVFDHTVINKPGYDFLVVGNSFYELNEPDKKGGSAEPGIVYVSYDANCNGIADDEWYELAGSEYYKSETIHGYSLVYTRPDESKKPEPDKTGVITDQTYIQWVDNQGETGYVAKNRFHAQDYYPKWVKEDELHFSGSKLANNGVDKSGIGRYFVLYAYPWGYVDNHPNEYEELNSFDISWAVDKDGNPVKLPGIDFVRVMTGVNQYCGWIGETSTELSGARDLHIKISDFNF